MATNSGYNPDALPAHAEPDQAAAMLSGRPHAGSVSRPPPQGRQHSGSLSQGYNKPQPPTPNATSPHPPHPGAGRGRPSLSGASNPYGSPPLSQNPSYNNYPPQGAPYGISPPPQQYSQHPPPPVQHNRPPINYRPPPTPAPPVNVPPPQAGAQSGDDSLFALFRAVDTDNSGRLDERELRSALVNGDWTSFDPHTVRMMIRMFDTERNGSISFDEFCGLWGFLAAWRTLFDRFDEDRSGNINLDEYSKALVAFGYRLTPPFISLLFKTYDKRAENAISFDLFVQSCISLKRMTDVFKRYDDDRDGYVTLSFEEFLTEILRQR